MILARLTGSDWYGMRRSIPSTAANAPSSSGAVEAPVHTLTLNRSPREVASVTRLTSAAGTAFG